MQEMNTVSKPIPFKDDFEEIEAGAESCSRSSQVNGHTCNEEILGMNDWADFVTSSIC
jgi:hypothetical protein